MYARINKTHLIILSTLLIYSNISLADQTVIPNYNKARDVFWNKLYPKGNWTIYCGVRFNNRKETVDGRKLSIEHVYPQSWVSKAMGCNSVSSCRKTNKKFNYAVADLHNMYPALRNVNSSRGNSLLSIIEGESWKYKDCDFERIKGMTEPREIARGNLARSILYMSSEYNLPIPEEMISIVSEWDKNDPVSTHELRRNNIIYKLQSTKNKHIRFLYK